MSSLVTKLDYFPGSSSLGTVKLWSQRWVQCVHCVQFLTSEIKAVLYQTLALATFEVKGESSGVHCVQFPCSILDSSSLGTIHLWGQRWIQWCTLCPVPSLVPRPSSFIRHAKWSGRPGIASHMTWRKDRKAGKKAISVHGHLHLRLAACPCISQRLQWLAPRLVNGPRDKARLGSIPDVSRTLEVRIQ